MDRTDGPHPTPEIQRIGVLLVPGFPMMAFSSAVEPLRAANLISGQPLYQWHLLSPDGEPVRASNGIPVVPDAPMCEAPTLDAIFVCSGLDPQSFEHPRAFAWLRDRAQTGTRIGALSTGTFALARAGLLDGFRCTTHWEHLPALAEAWPDLEVTGGLFEIDRDRFTSAGGTAAMDLILHLIANDHGNDLAAAVSNNFLHGRIRAPADRQPMTDQVRLRARAPKLATAIDLMQVNVEQPLSTADIAARIGISRRQLERLFQLHRQCTPSEYYMKIRLEHARVLLLETGLSLLNVALASGFVSQSHFGACYRAHFGHTPGDERRGVEEDRE
ncbi:MAG: GlxA family transcriptional regulator [Halofilum sp. (in: g-proteobacteria)]